MTIVAILDTETTGVGSDDEPVSVGVIAVRVDERGALVEEIGRYEGWREPSVPIHPKAQAVHGLTIDDLRGKQFDILALKTLINAADVIVAHNASFDARMIGVIMKVKPKWRCSYRQFPWGSMADKKLDTVCKEFGVERPATHGAMNDAEALLACLLKHRGKTERSQTYLSTLLKQTAYNVQAPSKRPDRGATGGPRLVGSIVFPTGGEDKVAKTHPSKHSGMSMGKLFLIAIILLLPIIWLSDHNADRINYVLSGVFIALALWIIICHYRKARGSSRQ